MCDTFVGSNAPLGVLPEGNPSHCCTLRSLRRRRCAPQPRVGALRAYPGWRISATHPTPKGLRSGSGNMKGQQPEMQREAGPT